MEPWHRARFDVPQAARSHHQIASAAQIIDEAPELRQIVRIVRIRHYDEWCFGLGDAALQRVAVAAARFGDDSRAGAARDFRGTVTGAVVDYQKFAGNPP